jgi:hypothetical protein
MAEPRQGSNKKIAAIDVSPRWGSGSIGAPYAQLALWATDLSLASPTEESNPNNCFDPVRAGRRRYRSGFCNSFMIRRQERILKAVFPDDSSRSGQSDLLSAKGAKCNSLGHRPR